MAVVEEKAVVYTATGFCDNVLHTLYHLQQIQKLCDVSLQARDGSVSVHSLVFAACSPVFQQFLLQKPAPKKNKASFPVPEVTLVQLKELIEFFYTGRLVLTTGNIDAYRKLFEKLHLEEAVILCNEFVSSQVREADMEIHAAEVSGCEHALLGDRVHSDSVTAVVAGSDDNTSNTNPVTDNVGNNDICHCVNDLESKVCSITETDHYTSISNKPKELQMSIEPVGCNSDSVSDRRTPVDDTHPNDSKSSPVRRSGRSRRISAKYAILKEEENKTMQKKSKKSKCTIDEASVSGTSSAVKEKRQTLTEYSKNKANKKKVTSDKIVMGEMSPTRYKKLKFTVSEDVDVKIEPIGKLTKKRKKRVTVKKLQQRRKKAESFECEYCNHFAVNFKALEMHKHSKHDIPYDPARHTIYTCKICGYQTLMSARLDIHEASHSDERPFVCETCGKSFKLSCELTMHAKVHTNPSMLDCTHCGKTFSTIYNLKDHIEHQHFGRKKFLCHLCCHRAINRLHLDRHLYKVHAIPLPAKCKLFTCDICDFESFKRYRFVEHMKRHKGEKDFICAVCKKGFVSRPALARHTIWHGEKKFKCTFGDCQYATVQKKSLEEHTRLMHTGKDEKPYVCHLCPHRSGLKGNLDKHLRSVHKINIVDKRRARYRFNPASSTDEFNRSMDITSEVFNMEELSLVKKEPITGEDSKSSMKQVQFEAALSEAIARSMKYDGSSETEEDRSHKSEITQTEHGEEPVQTWQPNTSCANSSSSLDIQADSSGIADYSSLQEEVAGAEFSSHSTDETAIIIQEMVQTDTTTPLSNIRLEEGPAGTQLTVICDGKSDTFSVLESVGFKFI